ncbi:tRNA pseudouridine(55) synthase TruB [Nocardioides caldifontis]|uniref:tRNA pseudouridine(55) synthase TruB n=1 Tax=Nocardioides caldifontis TaxID=2588938 RepID=UPI0011DF93BB|nr:tRNA pseudouridine(55) synthase TruB [Nocardioides caldifontis]
MTAVSGLVVVDKPAGLTSHDVVARVRRLARTRKVGHAGTLDPMATGVLLLGVEKATRLLGHLALADKRYDATVRLGAATTTDDAEGELLSSTPVDGVEEEAVRRCAAGFVGELQQVPSSVSAVKVGGRRAYARARAGEQVELAARSVTVHELLVHDVRRAGDHLDVDVSVHCTTGTYVRALARDLGAALGVGGHLTALRRTAVGGIGLDEATPLARLQEAGAVEPLPMADAAARFFPTVTVDAPSATAVGHGKGLPIEAPVDGRPVAVLGPDGAFLALYRRGDGEGQPARPVAVFV